ncbi:MAG TPA: bifunctional phosphopantothenoylcysteine decarboxylase/phosphopantothenate synthase, partial [Nitriliruptoraceae bacterium]|nr:bifunctional phosphopantothenoylcysteine decarboxylase/phosphopantothenate synthase [Nitriliruptoraceae bacterium]
MSATVAELASLTGRRIVVGVTGGIAAYKAPLVVRRLLAAGATVDVILTRGGARFVGEATFAGLTGRKVRSEVWEDIEDETHVALARRADVIAVYPATAHTLARAAAGMADDLLTTTLLATTAPVVMAPAMHTEMWEHAATQDNAAILRDRGVRLVGPDEGFLMGGDSGAGRAVEPDVFVAAVVSELHRDDPATPAVDIRTRRPLEATNDHRGPAHVAAVEDGHDHDLSGVHVVVSAGGTREPIDPVRHLGNASTGRMGFAIAEAAAARGATVELVAAPTHLETPDDVTRIDVVTAAEMHDVIVARAGTADVVIKAAAVADFRPRATSSSKIKKAGGMPSIEWVPNPDILATLGRTRADTGVGPTVLVGFAAETDDVEAHAMQKLASKQADLLVANDVAQPGAG